MIREITFEEIRPLWELLWPGRDDIRPMSSMIDNKDHDISIYEKYTAKYWGVFTDDTHELIACNSGHPTSDTRFRSRGLYVKFGYGGKGLGQLLLKITIEHAIKEGFETIWSCPRESAMKTYQAVGFVCDEPREEKEAWPASGIMQSVRGCYAELKLK